MRLLIVDDEAFARRGLADNLPWADLGITAVEQADDGVSALEKAATFRPDIVITDVRMPRMDGIELAREIARTHPRCRLIFLSAFSDKAYLKAAISLGAVEYVEKPVDLAEVSAAVARALAALTEAGKTAEQTLVRFLRGEPGAEFDTGGVTGAWRPVLVKTRRESPPAESTDALGGCTAVCSRLDLPTYRARLDPDLAVLLAATGSDAVLADLVQGLRQVVHEAPADAFVLIGRAVPAAALPDAFGQARDGLAERLFYAGYRHVVVPGPRSEPPADLAGAVTGFTSRLEVGDEIQVVAYLKGLGELLRAHPSTPVDAVRNTYLLLLLALQDAGRLRGVTFFPDPTKALWWKMLGVVETLEQIEAYVLHLVHVFFEQLDKDSVNYLVTMVEADIAAHYQEANLTLASICSRLYISPSHLCVVYKRKTGRTINGYLTGYRMDKAKQLIRNPRTRLQDVAHLVGYADANYFARLFKKVTGMTPSEYRKAAA